jgi:hypothetical protein
VKTNAEVHDLQLAPKSLPDDDARNAPERPASSPRVRGVDEESCSRLLVSFPSCPTSSNVLLTAYSANETGGVLSYSAPAPAVSANATDPYLVDSAEATAPAVFLKVQDP